MVAKRVIFILLTIILEFFAFFFLFFLYLLTSLSAFALMGAEGGMYAASLTISFILALVPTIAVGVVNLIIMIKTGEKLDKF